MDQTGILVKKLEERTGVSQHTGNPWRIAEFLLEVPGQRTKNIKFTVKDNQSDRIARFESMIGKTVTVSFDIDADLYNDKWYTRIDAWGIMEYVPGRQQ